MKEIGVSIVFFSGLAVLWFLLGVCRAIRDVLAERTAAWLLPPVQPITFRLAQFVALLARRLAPERYAVFHLESDTTSHWWWLLFPAQWQQFYWTDPESALAELDADLRAERPVLDPLRLVLPLLRDALRMRIECLRILWPFAVWLPFGIVLSLVLHAWISWHRANEWVRRDRRPPRLGRAPRP